MSSDLKVTNIKHESSSSNNLVLASDGNVSITNTLSAGTIGSGVSGFGLITMADQWRLNATLSSSNGPITTNFERVDDGWFAQIGTGMTESSGVFTFPQTGVYLVTVSGHFLSNVGGAMNYGGVHIYITQDNSSYTNESEKYASAANTGHYGSTHNVVQIDVDDTTNIKIKFYRAVFSTNFVTIGDTNSNQTTFTFIRLGDT